MSTLDEGAGAFLGGDRRLDDDRREERRFRERERVLDRDLDLDLERVRRLDERDERERELVRRLDRVPRSFEGACFLSLERSRRLGVRREDPERERECDARAI